jgi:CubicO group peptidase (beta-lactamase class C family)
MTLLGSVVERVSGKNFDSYMGESSFSILGMVWSSYSPKAGMTMAYVGYRNSKKASSLGIRDLPSNGMLSSVVDLGKFTTMGPVGLEIGWPTVS